MVAEPTEGARVTLVGLSRVELNGRCGRALRRVDRDPTDPQEAQAAGRWEIEIDGQPAAVLAIQTENLRLCDTPLVPMLAPLWTRAAGAWRALAAWAEATLPELHATLAPPADSQAWANPHADPKPPPPSPSTPQPSPQLPPQPQHPTPQPDARPAPRQAWATFLREVQLPHGACLAPLRALWAQHDGQAIDIDTKIAVENEAAPSRPHPLSLHPRSTRSTPPTHHAAAPSPHHLHRLRRHLLLAEPPWQVLDGPAPSLSRDAADRQRFLGLAGGYSAYNSSVSVRLFPLRLVAAWTNFLRGRQRATDASLPASHREDSLTQRAATAPCTYHFPLHALAMHSPMHAPTPHRAMRHRTGARRQREFPPMTRSMVVVAATYNLQKFFLYDTTSGALAVCPSRVEAGPLLRAVPATTPRGDDLLAWLEELGRRCESGLYRAERICQEIPSSIGLSLFPRRGAALAVAVTRGVEVASSAVFAPEQGCCIYSIRIRLLPAAEGGLSPQVPLTPGTP